MGCPVPAQTRQSRATANRMSRVEGAKGTEETVLTRSNEETETNGEIEINIHTKRNRNRNQSPSLFVSVPPLLCVNTVPSVPPLPELIPFPPSPPLPPHPKRRRANDSGTSSACQSPSPPIQARWGACPPRCAAVGSTIRGSRSCSVPRHGRAAWSRDRQLSPAGGRPSTTNPIWWRTRMMATSFR